MKKYVFMYNVDDLEKQEFRNKLSKATIDFRFEYFSFMPNFDEAYNVQSYEKVEDEGSSLWVLEDHYLVAFTILNYELLQKIDDKGFEYEVDDVVNWYKKYKDDKMFVCYK